MRSSAGGDDANSGRVNEPNGVPLQKHTIDVSSSTRTHPSPDRFHGLGGGRSVQSDHPYLAPSALGRARVVYDVHVTPGHQGHGALQDVAVAHRHLDTGVMASTEGRPKKDPSPSSSPASHADRDSASAVAQLSSEPSITSSSSTGVTRGVRPRLVDF